MNDIPGLLLISIIILPLLGSLVSWPAKIRARFVGLYTIVPVIECIIVASLWPAVQEGASIRFTVPWAPSLGLNVSLSLDGLSWLFAFLISGVGTLVFLYAASYMRTDPALQRLYRYLLLFNAAMMGVVLADNLVLLLVFWELTSVASFLLIGFRSDRPAAKEGATKAFGLTAIGGLCMLFGILRVFAEHGTFELSVLASQGATIPTGVGLCFLAAAFTKSAQFPFHIWLPSAMEAPTPVSAYLHAATMVKAGLYLIARLTPLFAGDPVWGNTVTLAGTLTLVWGGILACKQVDLKALLANSTVSQLGLIVALLGLQTKTAIFAAILHILNHAAFKGALFLTAGTVEHATHTRDIRNLGGIGKIFPGLAIMATLASLSMAGLPPMGGFVSKELFYEAALEHGIMFTALAVTASGFTFLYSFIFFHGTFFGSSQTSRPGSRETVVDHEHVSAGLLLPVGVLVGAAVLFGIIPGLAEALVAPAFHVVYGEPANLHLGLWHGLTPALTLTLVTVAAGSIAFTLRHKYLSLVRSWKATYSFNRLYAGSLDFFTVLFKMTRRLYMTGSVTDYVRYLLLALGLGLALPIWQFFQTQNIEVIPPTLQAHEVSLAALMAVAAFMCCRAHSRMVLILTLSLVGALMSIFFVLFSAPDLALTQILVEAVGLVLFLLVLRYFSVIRPREQSAKLRALNIGVSLGVGALVSTVLLIAHLGPSLPSSIPAYYLANSYVLAGGKNVVNVILVDFRGFDTLGEITVFSVAVFGVIAMIRLGPRGIRPFGAVRVWFPSPILQSFARLTLHFMLVLAIYLLFRGHNAPGGGFIAGVLTAVAITFQMIAFNLETFARDTPWDPVRLVVAGLVLAVGTGLSSLLVGYPFLTSAIAHSSTVLLGQFEIVSTLAFDLGVYLVVVGTSLGIIRTVAED